MNPEHFSYYKNFLYKNSGLAITEAKIYLLESRLTPVAKKHGFADLAAMTQSLRSAANAVIEKDVIDAMMTNETLFFRDERPFRQLTTNVMPSMVAARENLKSLRIWSAACSTGQEPYSIAMTIADNFPQLGNWAVNIMATDLSDIALTQARTAEYNQFEVQRGLPIQMLMKHFEQDGQKWRINEKIRKMVNFKNFNLLESMDALPRFDIILCRNVLIYFDEATKKKILSNMLKKLAPDGFLFLGGAESVMGLCPELKHVHDSPGLYTIRAEQPVSVQSAAIGENKPAEIVTRTGSL